MNAMSACYACPHFSPPPPQHRLSRSATGTFFSLAAAACFLLILWSKHLAEASTLSSIADLVCQDQTYAHSIYINKKMYNVSQELSWLK